MGIQRRKLGRSKIAVAGTVAVLASAGSAFALQGLPAGGQVNNDPAAGIDPAQGIAFEDPANADVVGGALTAGKVAVPWALFRQQEAGGGHDQVFSRSFAGGAWTTRGNGTVGGRSSSSPQFSGSLNFSQAQDGEAPSIDFAGAGRTVPWATWYETTTGAGFNAENIFSSRFDNTGDANQGKWLFSGQGRDLGGGAVPVPSLNIDTAEPAENPSVAGGTTTPGGNPGPWVTWQEQTTAASGTDQIFVVRPEPNMPNCDGVTPAGVVDGTGHVPAVGNFCWQQTGIPRVGAPLAPSLNVDPARAGIEPDIAFTGTGDNVPWVVWYETGAAGTSGTGGSLQGPNGMVFAAKAINDGVALNGNFHWVAVGNGGQGNLDGTVNGPGTCAHSLAEEQACSLNISPTADAEDPRVASGTMNAANPTVPWVAWDEGAPGHHQVFVSRLVGAGAAARFVPVNNGQAISAPGVDATRPDITFSGNTPYVTFRTDSGATATAVSGHFVNAANPTFVADTTNVQISPATPATVREPISSGCTANPFNGDGATCQGGALGTPFFLFTNGTSPRGLFADAYQSDAPVTGASSGVGQTTATVSGSVNPEGARTTVAFQYGTTTAYGQSTAAQTTGPDNAPDAFSAALSGLPVGTVIHYRAVATDDFGTQAGADQTLTTQSPPVVPGRASVKHARVTGTTVSVPIACKGDTSCRVFLKLTVVETLRGHRLIAVSARKAKLRHKTVVLGTKSATIKPGRTLTVHIGLNRTGRKLLAARHKLTAKLTVTQRISGRNRTLSTQKVTFKAPKHHRRHGGG